MNNALACIQCVSGALPDGEILHGFPDFLICPFAEKVNEICTVYHEAVKNHEAGGHTISVDEMTGIQALEHKYPDKPVIPGKFLGGMKPVADEMGTDFPHILKNGLPSSLICHLLLPPLKCPKTFVSFCPELPEAKPFQPDRGSSG